MLRDSFWHNMVRDSNNFFHFHLLLVSMRLTLVCVPNFRPSVIRAFGLGSSGCWPENFVCWSRNFPSCINESLVKSAHFCIRLELLYNASQKDGLTYCINVEELCVVPYAYVGMLGYFSAVSAEAVNGTTFFVS